MPCTAFFKSQRCPSGPPPCTGLAIAAAIHSPDASECESHSCSEKAARYLGRLVAAIGAVERAPRALLRLLHPASQVADCIARPRPTALSRSCSTCPPRLMCASKGSVRRSLCQQPIRVRRAATWWSYAASLSALKLNVLAGARVQAIHSHLTMAWSRHRTTTSIHTSATLCRLRKPML